MNVRLRGTKIVRAIALSGFLCLFWLPSATAQATAVQQPEATKNSGQQQSSGPSAERASGLTQETQSSSSTAKIGQASPPPGSKKDMARPAPAKKNVQAPHVRMKNQVPRSPLQVTPDASSTSAPAVPGLNDFAPGKVVVSNGGAPEVRLQLTPTATPAEAAERRRQTMNLLWISNENLKRIAGHDLDANQQDMLEQVHNYMTQARAADKAGELQRAQILASKARQLSDDLAGVRTILKLWPW